MFNRDRLFSTPISNLDEWIFNEQVVQVFPDMIQRSIPGYSTIISIISIIANRFVQPSTKFYDLGCSLGAVALSVSRSIYQKNCKIIAIDNSAAMIKRFRCHINKYKPLIPVEIIEGDIRDIDIENASMVVLNFTLQFLHPNDRQIILDKIYKGLNRLGILILSEKISFEDLKVDKLISNIYYDFKRYNGYSELEIKQKRDMLEKVMFTDSIETYKARLYKAGFIHSALLFQFLNFVSLLSIKE